MQITGNRTYLTLAAIAAYLIAVKLGYAELDPEILSGGALAAAAFMRMGIDNAKKAVEAKVADVSAAMTRPPQTTPYQDINADRRPPMPPTGTTPDPTITSPYPPGQSPYPSSSSQGKGNMGVIIAGLLLVVGLGAGGCTIFGDKPDGSPSDKVVTITEILDDFQDVAVEELGYIYDDYPDEFSEAVVKFINTAEELEDGRIADPDFVRTALKAAIPDDLDEDQKRTASRIITGVIVAYRIAYNDAIEVSISNGGQQVLEKFVDILKKIREDKGF